eukprot:jgi/Tetstr1/424517/TSEL_015045.t1
MATQQAEEGSNRLGKPVRPCGPPGHDEAHQEHLPAKQPADTGLDRSRGSLVAVGDSAQSFDFGVASSSSLAVSVAEAGTAVALGDGKVEAVNPALDVKDEAAPDIARGGSYFGAQANADDAESKVRDVHAEARKAPDAPDLGVDGLRQCKGSYAAAMEATRKRADKEAHERARLAAELSKRRAQVSAREAKENKAKTKAEMRSAPRRPGSCVPKKAAPPMVQHSLAQQHAPVVAANIYAAPAPVPYPAGQPVAKPARKGVVNQALDASFEVSDCGDSDDGQELPDDWEAQIAAPRPSVPKHMQRAPGPRPASSNFARSPLAAALMQLVGLPGMHAPNAMPMAPPSAGPTPGMLGPAMADAALERLTAEEDALLKSLSRLDPKMLRKSLKSAGMDLWSHEGYLQLSNSAEQGKLLKSLARLDMQLQALRAHQGVHARFMAIRSKYHECHLPLPRLCPGANSSQFMAITATLQLVLRSREHAGTCLRQQLITRLATLATKCLECKGQDGLGLATTALRLLQAGTVLPLVNHQAALLVVPHLGCR